MTASVVYNKAQDADLALNLDEAIARMGDREIYIEIARYFASHLQNSLQDLVAALNNDKTDEASRLAHSLKSNCATVGADMLRERCFTLEKLCRQGDIEGARSSYAALLPKLLALRELLLHL